MNWTSERTSENVVTVRMSSTGMGWEQRFLISADRHHDNPDCKRGMEKRHLDEAKRIGAGIIDIGDLFCAMQGKADPRADKAHIDPKFCDGNYFDAIVNDAEDFYGEYANNIIQLSPGNHETAVRKHHETDLTKRLVRRLNSKSNHEIFVGQYTGWIMFRIKHNITAKCSKSMWYTHGYGGGGPVTEDMIQSNRQQVFIEADIMASGHVHRSWNKDFVKIGLGHDGIERRREGIYIKVPTYKDSYGKDGYESENGHGPRPLGACWLVFSYKQRKKIDIDVMRAR
jgi:hypothetical protein